MGGCFVVYCDLLAWDVRNEGFDCLRKDYKNEALCLFSSGPDDMLNWHMCELKVGVSES